MTRACGRFVAAVAAHAAGIYVAYTLHDWMVERRWLRRLARLDAKRRHAATRGGQS